MELFNWVAVGSNTTGGGVDLPPSTLNESIGGSRWLTTKQENTRENRLKTRLTQGISKTSCSMEASPVGPSRARSCVRRSTVEMNIPSKCIRPIPKIKNARLMNF